MDNSSKEHSCINCEKTEAEAPILRMRFKGEEAAICSSCLPVLIHRPEKLAGRLKGAETIEPSSHKH